MAQQVNLENKRDPVLVFFTSITHTLTATRHEVQARLQRSSVSSCVLVAHGVQAALGRCKRARRTPPQWLPTPRWAIALTALAGNFLFQRWACGQRKRLKWRQAARAAWSPASLSRSGTGTLTSWLPTCISRPMCSAEVLSFCPWNACPQAQWAGAALYVSEQQRCARRSWATVCG